MSDCCLSIFSLHREVLIFYRNWNQLTKTGYNVSRLSERKAMLDTESQNLADYMSLTKKIKEITTSDYFTVFEAFARLSWTEQQRYKTQGLDVFNVPLEIVSKIDSLIQLWKLFNIQVTNTLLAAKLEMCSVVSA
jgi:hypothetical protein